MYKMYHKVLLLLLHFDFNLVEAFGSKETILSSVLGGFILLVMIVIAYHCYLKRQQLKSPYNDELLGKIERDDRYPDI